MRYFFLLFLAGCVSIVSQKEFDDYKTLHTFKHIDLKAGTIFIEDKFEVHKDDFKTYIKASRLAAEATNKKFEKELAELTSFYWQLDRDAIDYIWHEDKIIKVR